MHNFRRFYYQNKEKIWKVVLIIAFLLGLIYYMNDLVEKQSNPSNVVAMPEKDIYSDTQNKTYISDKSPVTGGTVTKQEVEIINNTISKFLENCKNEKYEQAYNMLSVECKENGYDTLEKFKNEYIKSRFKKENSII